jgi:hypothetical protein
VAALTNELPTSTGMIVERIRTQKAIFTNREMAIPTLFLPPETADLPDRQRVKD